MKATVDIQVCIGCTLCAQICPSVFKMEKDKSVAYRDPVPHESYECVRNAAEQCPVQAITLAKQVND